ncbi:MAG: DEAD/DEAH box helicase [Phycisphaeraceae bacterium]|nr:DEAD/DEAH box helicase [Phycisphaeraceae bacterium]
MLQFSSLGLADPILRSLNTEGYTTPTPIQAQAIPPVLEGRDLLGCAQTGTGKTAAFALPILHRLHAQPADKSRRGPALPRVLVLSPTRELATQIGESFAVYGRHTGLSHTVIFGGVSQYHQVKALQRGVDVLVATPGRLIDLMEQRLVNLSAVRVLVLDEADRMLDMGFIQPIRRIVAALTEPQSRQTLLFSATMPREIMHLADSLLRNPVKVAVTPVSSAVPLIEQSLYMVPRNSKQSLLERLLENRDVTRAVVFTKTKHGADRVARRLARAGVSSDAIHGNKAQNQRTRALDAFRSGRVRVLVATDVAARGLDVDGITHVFNFDLPMEPEAYVHRIGRTGRAGATGIAVSFCDHEERGLLRDIEKLTGKAVPRLETPTDLPVIPKAEHAPHPAHGGHAPRRPQQPARGGPRHQSGHDHRAPHPKPHPKPHAKPNARPHIEAKPRHAGASTATRSAGVATPARGMRAWNRPTGGSRAGR